MISNVMFELSLPFFSMFLFGLLISIVFKGRLAKMFIFTAILALIVEFVIIMCLSFMEVNKYNKDLFGSLIISNLILTFLLMATTSSGFVISLCKVELLSTEKNNFLLSSRFELCGCMLLALTPFYLFLF